MLRNILSFFSMLAFGVMSAAAIVAITPWLTGRVPGSAGAALGGLHLESVLLGLMLGLSISMLGHYEWAEIPRRVISWMLVRERQFFYYTLMAAFVGVLLFY